MLKKLFVLATLAGALAIGAAPASAAPSVCLTTDVNVNGTALPTNGTTCLPQRPARAAARRLLLRCPV